MNKPILGLLGRNIQTFCMAKGLSLPQFVRDAGLAKSNLSRIEQGDGNPCVDVYWMSCALNTIKQSEPHIAGTTETVTLISGKLLAGEKGQPW